MDQTVTFEFDYAPDEMPVEKDAKIFEAGDYPDKGVTIAEEDLDAIVGNFAEVPVKVEHTDSPLDPLGVVKRIWRQGRELFARLAFPRDLAAFLERRGVKKLSVALHRDPLRLAEVSLVVNPRVSSAAMFGDPTPDPSPKRRGEVPAFETQAGEIPPLPVREGGQGVRLEERGDSHTHPDPPPSRGRGLLAPSPLEGEGWGEGDNPQSAVRNPQCKEEVIEGMSATGRGEVASPADKEIAELRFALRAKDVEAKLAELKAQGKIVPASEPYAREILLQGDGKITFGEGETTIAQLFECFLAGQPKVVIFGELAPGAKTPAAPLSAEDEEVLAKLGVTRDQVEKYAGDS